MNIIFMSSSEFGLPTLQKLVESKNKIIAVYTKPPKQSGRGLKVNKSIIHQYAEQNNLNIRTPADFRGEAEIDFMKKSNPDLGIVVSYGLIIPARLLEITRFGFLNIHPSLLPKWRGAAPIQRAIINGDKNTGINIIKLDDGLDTGDICKKIVIDIKEIDNNETLSLKLSKIGADLMMQVIGELKDGDLSFTKQDKDNITYAEKVDKSETKLDFNQTAKEVNNKIRGLSPYPGAWFYYKDETNGFRARIIQAEILEESGQPGEIINNELSIACGDNAIKPILIQKEGKKPMHIKDFLLGTKIQRGVIVNKSAI